MKRIYISSVLSADLKSRSTVSIFYDYIIQNSYIDSVVDFSGVNFATRSFVDEFYNVFIKTHRVIIENIPADIQLMFDAVGMTQNKEKQGNEQNNIKSFSSVDALCSYMSALAF